MRSHLCVGWLSSSLGLSLYCSWDDDEGFLSPLFSGLRLSPQCQGNGPSPPHCPGNQLLEETLVPCCFKARGWAKHAWQPHLFSQGGKRGPREGEGWCGCSSSNASQRVLRWDSCEDGLYSQPSSNPSSATSLTQPRL